MIRIFMNRMKTVIKLTFAHVKGVFKFMAKLILGTFGQACPVSTYMAESEKAKRHYQAYEANRNVHKALWAQVHNCRIIEAIITVWLTTTSLTSSYGILESCRQQHYCHQHHHQHHYCRKKSSPPRAPPSSPNSPKLKPVLPTKISGKPQVWLPAGHQL